MSYSFLDFSVSDEIKHLFRYGIDIYFCPEGVFTTIRIMQGLSKRCSSGSVLCAGQKSMVSEDSLGSTTVERILRNDEEYKEYLEDIEAISWVATVEYLKCFSVKKERDSTQIQRNYAWYLAITREENN
ncbi:AKR_collapsed_G0028140.mRNA.1.CDS.1 [Saccharomyces cerevisiae]|nr:AKR_collapsed_G0028140.mRNA.1.CDS.1 [Saccharomyces cerevisiae]